MKRVLFLVLVLAIALAAVGCDLLTNLFAPPQAPGYGEGLGPTDARDSAVSYVNDNYGVGVYSGPDWDEERLTPPGLVGAEKWRYTALGWEVIVRWPVIPNPDYAVTIRGSLVLWDGTVYSSGEVEELGWADARPPSVIEFDRISARDVAIKYINDTDPSSGIPLDADWQEEDVTPAGLVGSALYRYTFEDWRIWVSYPIVPIPDYRVEVTNFATEFYWQGTVRPTGVVEPIPPIVIEGEVVVAARGSRSESWGIRVTDGPPDYIAKDVGLKSYMEMKEELEAYEGQQITATVPKICRSFDEGCCACVFEFCAPFVLSWEPILTD